MEYTKEQLESIYEKFYSDEKLDFKEFLILLSAYGELEFSYKFTDYGVLRLNDDYTHRKDQEWNRAKDYYAIFEIKNPGRGRIYKSLGIFADKANIKGLPLKDIWHSVAGLQDLSNDSYHGVDGVHEHAWTGMGERGPARVLG